LGRVMGLARPARLEVRAVTLARLSSGLPRTMAICARYISMGIV
jgi:hypothetical protein